jgi:hypothetical protein
MSIKRLAVVFLIVALALIYIFINPSEVDFLPKCPFYVTTGFYCAGCGSQRATHQLLNLNFLGVLQQNIFYAFVLMLLTYQLVITFINKFFKKNIYNYLYHPKVPILFLIIIMLFWVLRNIPIYPFYLLAPK